jgi:hypothetical protein
VEQRNIMKINKIIYFVIAFCKRDYKRFGIEIINNNGFSTEVWDLAPVIYSKVYEKIKVPDPIDYKKSSCRLFLHKDEVIKEISRLKSDTLVITVFDISFNTYFLYKELSKKNVLYGFLYADTIPKYKTAIKDQPLLSESKIDYLFEKIRGLNYQKVKKYLFRINPFRYSMIKFPALILAGGFQTMVNYNSPVGKKTKIIWGHTLDYDLYLNDLLKPSKNKLKGKEYAVFIDQYLPFAPDFVYMGIDSPLTPKQYYYSLCKFFNSVEKETGLDIIIAAHPRSNYEEYQNYFKGRKVICGGTMELIRDSELVLMHYSASLSFAVLYNKPILFFITDEMEKCAGEVKKIFAHSSELNKKFINIDNIHKINWDKELSVDKETYANYKEKYLKRKGTEEKPFWQIIADGIKAFNFYK